jgi:proteasome lid subunit RPN8/RPN11
VAALEYVVGFFNEAYVRCGAEAIVLVFWDMRRKRYWLCVPPQKASVWQSQSGVPYAIDVTYDAPTSLPPDHLVVGDIHSHADLNAYSSYVDTNDEQYRDGVHIVVGRVDREPPEFHLEMTVDGFRFPLKFGQFFKGYGSRRLNVPKAWLRQVKIRATRATWTDTYSQSSCQNNAYGGQSPNYQPKGKNSNWDKRA